MITILLVEDDTTFSAILDGYLSRNGYKVDPCYSVKSALQALAEKKYDLLLLDYRLGDGDCLEIIDSLHKKNLFIPSIVMTGFSDVRTAVRAMKKGVYDFITKPVNPEELLMTVQESLKDFSKTDQAVDVPAVSEKLAYKVNQVKKSAFPDYIEGTSKLANKLHEYIQLVAPTDMSILIRGESGTGKEYVARAIHKSGKRADKPFISIDCGTLSKELAASELFGHIKGSFTGAFNDKKGLFEEASGGTLFLDEIGNLSYDVQVKLLRALQERVIQPIGANKTIKVDVRVIAATNDELIGIAESGTFREDLYHRINEFEILVPALRDREADLFIFTDFLIKEANQELSKEVSAISDEVREVFEQYEWPGNIRELKNIVKRMILLTNGNLAEVSSLPDYMIHSTRNKDEIMAATGEDLRSQNDAHERKLIVDVLQKVKYNKSKAAKVLEIDRKTLYNKLEKYDIE